jgi:hypothetical protein
MASRKRDASHTTGSVPSYCPRLRPFRLSGGVFDRRDAQGHTKALAGRSFAH